MPYAVSMPRVPQDRWRDPVTVGGEAADHVAVEVDALPVEARVAPDVVE